MTSETSKPLGSGDFTFETTGSPKMDSNLISWGIRLSQCQPAQALSLLNERINGMEQQFSGGKLPPYLNAITADNAMTIVRLWIARVSARTMGVAA